jgi:hypothetical protein
VAEQGCLLISKDAETKDLLHLPAFAIIYHKPPACNQLNSKYCFMLSASGSDKIRDNTLAVVLSNGTSVLLDSAGSGVAQSLVKHGGNMTETNADLDYQRYKGSPLNRAGVIHHSVYTQHLFSGICHLCKRERMVHVEAFRCQNCYYAAILFPVTPPTRGQA